MLNAFRHPRRSPHRYDATGAAFWRCSTPSGIPADHHSLTTASRSHHRCAQRLPASPPITTHHLPRGGGPLWGCSTPSGIPADHHVRVGGFEPPTSVCSTPSGIPADHHGNDGPRARLPAPVLNAFRHPRRSPPRSAPAPRRAPCAQRLPASPPITTRPAPRRVSRRRVCSTPSGIPADHHHRDLHLPRLRWPCAQRLPASPPITTATFLLEFHLEEGSVLNAFRHPRRSPRVHGPLHARGSECSTPSGIPADHHRGRRSPRLPRERVLNAFRHPRRSPQRPRDRAALPARVLNAFRHPRRSPRL